MDSDGRRTEKSLEFTMRRGLPSFSYTAVPEIGFSAQNSRRMAERDV